MTPARPNLKLSQGNTLSHEMWLICGTYCHRMEIPTFLKIQKQLEEKNTSRYIKHKDPNKSVIDVFVFFLHFSQKYLLLTIARHTILG